MAAQPPAFPNAEEPSHGVALHACEREREHEGQHEPERRREHEGQHDGEGRGERDGRQETAMERLDRNLEELTGELRVVVTGVQVLFAFLLVVPFDTGFAHVGDFERTVYFVTLLLAALAAACTIAPSAQHRLLFRHYDKQRLVFVSNRMMIAGLGALALAMCGSVLLVASTLFGVLAGVLTAGVVAVPFALLWFAVPLRRKRVLGARRRSAER